MISPSLESRCFVMRTTEKRKNLFQILKSARRPQSAAEILDLARKKQPTINKTTVYRFLNRLVSSGLIDCARHRHGAILYSLYQKKSSRNFFVCESCSKYLPLNNPIQELDKLVPFGCVLYQHELLLRGKCQTCSSKMQK